MREESSQEVVTKLLLETMAKVLIAEDTQTDAVILQRTVEELNHTPICVGDGSAAWAKIQEDREIALLITDLRMPGMDGEQLVARIRAHATLKRLPVVIVSGVVPVGEIFHILELGASRFLPKPLNVVELKMNISALLPATK